MQKWQLLTFMLNVTNLPSISYRKMPLLEINYLIDRAGVVQLSCTLYIQRYLGRTQGEKSVIQQLNPLEIDELI